MIPGLVRQPSSDKWFVRLVRFYPPQECIRFGKQVSSQIGISRDEREIGLAIRKPNVSRTDQVLKDLTRRRFGALAVPNRQNDISENCMGIAIATIVPIMTKALFCEF